MRCDGHRCPTWAYNTPLRQLALRLQPSDLKIPCVRLPFDLKASQTGPVG